MIELLIRLLILVAIYGSMFYGLWRIGSWFRQLVMEIRKCSMALVLMQDKKEYVKPDEPGALQKF